MFHWAPDVGLWHLVEEADIYTGICGAKIVRDRGSIYGKEDCPECTNFVICLELGE